MYRFGIIQLKQPFWMFQAQSCCVFHDFFDLFISGMVFQHVQKRKGKTMWIPSPRHKLLFRSVCQPTNISLSFSEVGNNYIDDLPLGFAILVMFLFFLNMGVSKTRGTHGYPKMDGL